MTKQEKLARKIWRIAYRAAMKVEPSRYTGTDKWETSRSNSPGCKAAWLAIAAYVMKGGAK